MADRGFTVENLLKPLGVSLDIQEFLHGRKQLTNEGVTESNYCISADTRRASNFIVKNFQNIAKNSFVPSTKIKYHIKFPLKH